MQLSYNFFYTNHKGNFVLYKEINSELLKIGFTNKQFSNKKFFYVQIKEILLTGSAL